MDIETVVREEHDTGGQNLEEIAKQSAAALQGMGATEYEPDDTEDLLRVTLGHAFGLVTPRTANASELYLEVRRGQLQNTHSQSTPRMSRNLMDAFKKPAARKQDFKKDIFSLNSGPDLSERSTLAGDFLSSDFTGLKIETNQITIDKLRFNLYMARDRLRNKGSSIGPDTQAPHDYLIRAAGRNDGQVWNNIRNALN